MQHLITLSKTELVLTFAASCIEGAAHRLGLEYHEIFERMRNVNLIEEYIIPFYDVLHLESREHALDDVIECLKTWEQQ